MKRKRSSVSLISTLRAEAVVLFLLLSSHARNLLSPSFFLPFPSVRPAPAFSTPLISRYRDTVGERPRKALAGRERERECPSEEEELESPLPDGLRRKLVAPNRWTERWAPRGGKGGRATSRSLIHGAPPPSPLATLSLA